MKPIKLELMGLNSYAEKQTIDFEKLTSRGLFGIFGNTGSGKSTILDAITIALYGDISRDTKDYINCNSEKAVIRYEFEIGNKNNRTRYFIERIIKSTPQGGTKTDKALLAEMKEDGNIHVVADKVKDVNKAVEDIIGLTSNDFTRSVVLPQGKFSEFLKLQGKDRRKMLERIFNLEKYGEQLSFKVKIRKDKVIKEIVGLNGGLDTYKKTSEEEYEETKQMLIDIKNTEKSKVQELHKLEKEFEESKVVFEDQKSLQNLVERKSILDENEDDIKIKRDKLEKSERGEIILPHINDIKILEKDIHENSSEAGQLTTIIENQKKEIDLLSVRYEESKKQKNEKLPLLIEEKGKLERAIDLETEIESLSILAKEVKLEIEKNESQRDIVKNEIQQLQYQSEIKTKKAKEINENIERLTISTNLKEEIIEAYTKEQEVKKLFIEIQENEQKKKNIENNIQDLKYKDVEVQRNKKSVNDKTKKILEHKELLDRSCPGDNKLIITEKEHLHNLKSKRQNISDYEKQIDDIKEELSSKEKIKFDNNRHLSESTQKIEKIDKEIKELKKEQDKLQYENMAMFLREQLKDDEACPVCGSKHHEKIHRSSNYEELKQVEEKVKNLENEYLKEKKNNDELLIVNREINLFDSMKKQSLGELLNKLGDNNSKLLGKEIEIKQKELKILEEKVLNWQSDKDKTLDEIYKLKDIKNEIEKEEVKIKENLNLDTKTNNELNNKIEELNKVYENLNYSYLTLKTKIKINDLASKVKQISENEKLVEKLNKEIMIISKENQLLDIEVKDKNIEFNELDKKISNLLQSREVNHKELKNKENDLNKIAKGISPLKLLKSTIENIDKITNDENELNQKLSTKKQEFDENIKIKSEKDGILSQATKQLETKNETIKTLLIEHKFESTNSVEQFILEKELKDKYKGEIDYFDEETKNLIIKISDLTKKLDGRSVKKEELENIHILISSLKNEITSIGKEIGSVENELRNIETCLSSIKQLTKELKKVEHERSLLEEIDKLIKGNKFVEYVATNQLKYIALEASKRLGIITKGRYALEIDENLNFIMRDNMNGGQRRSVDSLSGGETFLTSLSLSLALSSQIQLKGSSPLEFFFLDEGFGSLDIDLLDIVMESLENLHSEKLSIGIISHVEELKNRVPVKLLVEASDVGRGSRVKIEYS